MAPILKRRLPNKPEKRTEPRFYRLSDRNGASLLVHRLRAGLALFVVVLALNAPKTVSAQPDTDRSLNADKPVTEPESKEAAEQAALKTLNLPPSTNAAPSLDMSVPGQPETTANADVSTMSREQLEAKVKSLTENLASANAETEYFRQQWVDLRLRDEALGVEALTVDETKLEEKLVQAVKELYQSEMKRREALNILNKLMTTTGKLIQTAPNYDPKVRADYEVATRAARDYIAGHFGSSIPLGTSISDAQISDVSPDANDAILNVGKTQGVKEGMIFLIYRDNQKIGSVAVVMARDLVCAAKVLNLQSKVGLKVGDRAQVDAGP